MAFFFSPRPVTEQLMAYFYEKMGVHPNEYESFMHPERHSPFEMKGVREWIEHLHVRKDRHIVIDTDYDADGICSAVVLAGGLEILGFPSENIHIYVPRMDLGYGLTPQAVSEIKEQFPESSLIVTADNGVNAYEGISEAVRLGFDVLVSDHHLGGNVPVDALAVVDPNQKDCPSVYKEYCGAVVAYKLLEAYAQVYGTSEMQERLTLLTPFLAIATVADMMVLRGENRLIVEEGLCQLTKTGWVKQQVLDADTLYLKRIFRGLSMLLAGIKEEKLIYNDCWTVDTFGYVIGPMLNAPRRLYGSPRRAFDLFLSDTQYAHFLVDINETRKSAARKLKDGAQSVFSHFASKYSVCMLSSCVVGLAGLNAGFLCQELKKPTIVFASGLGEPDDPSFTCRKEEWAALCETDAVIHGSGRAPVGFDIHAVLEAVHQFDPTVMVSYGGHAGACGLAIHVSKAARFMELFEYFSYLYIEANSIDPLINAGFALNILGRGHVFPGVAGLSVTEQASLLAVLDEWERWGPFGHGWRKPAVTVVVDIDDHLRMGKHKNHIKWAYPGMDVIGWNEKDRLIDGIKKSCRYVRIMGQLAINEFNGRRSVQLIGEDFEYLQAIPAG